MPHANDETLAPGVEDVYRDVVRYWQWALISPLIYLGLALLADSRGWVEPVGAGDHPLDGPALIGALAVVTLLCLTGVGWLRATWRSGVMELREDPAGALRFWRRRFIAMACLSDLIACCGLVYYVLSGRMIAVLVLGVVAYVAYALAYPRPGDLTELDAPPEYPD